MVGAVVFQDLLAEMENLTLVGDVADMSTDLAAWSCLGLGHPLGFPSRTCLYVAGGDRASFAGQLNDQLSSPTRAASCDDRELACERFHP